MSSGANYTLVPDVIDALVAMFTSAQLTGAAGLPTGPDGQAAELAVFDGPPTTDVPANYVAVGYATAFAAQAFSGTTGLAVAGSLSLSDVGNRQFGESFAVDCEVSTASGDADRAALSRHRRYTRGVFNAMASTIAADPTLGGVVRAPAYAAVTSYRWLLDMSEEGCAATIQFSVGVVGELWVPV